MFSWKKSGNYLSDYLSSLELLFTFQMSCNIRKLSSDRICAQWRLQSAYTSKQSDQSSCLHEETSHPWILKMYPRKKILIRLCECAGWSESSLGAHVQRYVFCHSGSNVYIFIHMVCILWILKLDMLQLLRCNYILATLSVTSPFSS